MRIYRIWAFILSALSFMQCKTVEYTPSTYEGGSITWGSGGGMTGHVTCTAILDNGHYFSGQGLKDIAFEKKGRLSREQTAQLFENFETLGLADVNVDLPGNTYRFIERVLEGQTHRIVWGSKDDLPNANAVTMYNVLKNRIEKDNE